MTDSLESEFDKAMMDVYRRAKDEAGYTASRFLQMLLERKGLSTARELLAASAVSEGFTALWERNRLDLTVETLVLAPAWRSLFSDEERRIASERLAKYLQPGAPPGKNDSTKPRQAAERITINPRQCGGKPCIRGLRIRVVDVLGLLAHGATAAEILQQFPDLEMEDIKACFEFAVRQIDSSGAGNRGAA